MVAQYTVMNKLNLISIYMHAKAAVDGRVTMCLLSERLVAGTLLCIVIV